jgi:hypothetical protein
MASRIACYRRTMAVKVPPDVRQFAIVGQDVEAVVQRCGLNTVDCVLIAVDGTWTRAVFPSREAAQEACRDLGVRFHEGWDDPRLAHRLNRRERWGRAGRERPAV